MASASEGAAPPFVVAVEAAADSSEDEAAWEVAEDAEEVVAEAEEVAVEAGATAARNTAAVVCSAILRDANLSSKQAGYLSANCIKTERQPASNIKLSSHSGVAYCGQQLAT